MLYDTHCHLNDNSDEELAGIVSRAKDVGLGYILQAGTSKGDVERDIKISEKFSDNEIRIGCAVAIHPENVVKEWYEMDEIVKVASSSSHILAIGETGLDTHTIENEDFFDKQVKSFENHIVASLTTSKPLILHLRGDKAITKAIDMLRYYSKNNTINAVLHSYTGDYDNGKRALDCGCYISFSGIVTFKSAKDLRDVVRRVPIESMFVETDAPFLSPEPMRGRKNETSFVSYTARFLCDFLGVEYDIFCDTTTNAVRFFKNKN